MILFALFTALFTGCAGYREIDSEYLITAIGFEEREGKFAVYAEVLEVAADKKDTKSERFSAAGVTPYEAVENIAGLLPKKAVFDHCGTAIVSVKTKGENLKKIIKYLFDTKNLNLGICLYCAEDVEKILAQKPQGVSVGYDIMAIKSNLEKATGVSFRNKYYEICALQMEKGVFCLPKTAPGENGVQISGQVVYEDFSPVLKFEKSESALFNLLRFGAKGGEISLKGKKCRFNKVSVKTKKAGKKVKVQLNCEFRDKKTNCERELKSETESLLMKIKKTPAAVLISPALTAAKSVEVAVYDR